MKDDPIMPRYLLFSLTAIIIWSSLANLGSYVTSVPSLLLIGISLLISGILSLVKIKEWRVPKRTIIIGVSGIFGYHFLLFTAYKYAPIVEANLLNYLWPLFIVFLSPIILPRYTLRGHHMIGTTIGLLGAILIITGGKVSVDVQYLTGYLLAIGAALVWALYSLLTKRVAEYSTFAIGGFCTISGTISLLLYFIVSYSTGLYTPSGFEWMSLILLGLGPMGLAFYLWDKSLKEGDPRIIGSISYLTPLLSTLWLFFFSGKPFSSVSGLAMIFLIIGSAIGSLDVLRKREGYDSM